MPFINALLQMNPILMLTVFIILFSGTGIFGTLLYRKYIRVRIDESHNEITSNGFAMVGGFYGLLLAFVVFLVWDQFNSAQQNADMEGSLSKGLYRDIKFYPASNDSASILEKKMLTLTFVNYIKDVLTEDSLLDKEGVESLAYIYFRDTVTVKSFNTFFKLIEHMHDSADYKNQRIEQMLEQLNDLATYRSLRGLALDSEIDFYIWIPLWLGGFITMLFAFMMNIENKNIHIIINGLIGAFIALIFYIIVLSDHPFTGRLRIDIKKSMGKIITWEEGGMMDEK